MSLPTTVDGVVERMREIDAELDRGDGVGVFNRVYLTVTERIEEIIARPGAAPPFRDAESIAQLDVRFAHHWLSAYDADRAGQRVSTPWRPLFEARAGGRLPVQYALAGINTHIEHDLAIAVVDTCAALDLEPDDIRQDYDTVNDVLAEIEAPIRRSFLDEAELVVDNHLGPVVHLISSWKIDKARDLSWVTAEALWVLRRTDFLHGRFLDALGHTVGMTSRVLLTPLG